VAAVYAEAEAEADPAFLYAGSGLYSPLAYGIPFKSAPCVNNANIPVPCNGGVYGAYAYPYAYAGLGYYGRKKREAEADPQVLAAAYPYAYAPYAVGLTHPSNVGICLNYVGQQVPC
jgi:hypothetical protein